jgi:NADH-quinone oxidoreductase subunit E
LHDVQADNNSLSEAELLQVARTMDIPLSRVYGVATFYSMYSVRPRGKYVIRICESAPCHITGAQAVIRAFEQALGIRMGETTKDRKFTLEYTSCLGVCGVAPAVMINDQVYGNLTPSKVQEVLANYDET